MIVYSYSYKNIYFSGTFVIIVRSGDNDIKSTRHRLEVCLHARVRYGRDLVLHVRYTVMYWHWLVILALGLI